MAGASRHLARIGLSRPGGSWRDAALATAAVTPPWHRHRGLMWMTFGHLRPSGHIMPDHARDRGAVPVVLAPHGHRRIKHVGEAQQHSRDADVSVLLPGSGREPHYQVDGHPAAIFTAMPALWPTREPRRCSDRHRSAAAAAGWLAGAAAAGAAGAPERSDVSVLTKSRGA
jgi:hypothetical protein